MKNNILKKLRGNIVSFFTNLRLKFAPVRYIHCVVQDAVADAIVDHEHEFTHSNDYIDGDDVSSILDDFESDLEGRISRNLDLSNHMNDILYEVDCAGYLSRDEVQSLIDDEVGGYVHEDDFVDHLKNYGKVDDLIRQAVQDLVDERVKAQVASMIRDNHYIFKIESIKYLSNS